MKHLIFIVLFFLAATGQAFSIDTIDTTTKLPNDEQIWPLTKLDQTKEIIVVEAEYFDQKELLSVVQGNWRATISLVRYNVLKRDVRYPYDRIAFVAKDTWPAPGSNIRAKKLMWPFKKGIKTFYLKKDKNVKHKQYFNIVTYSK